MSIYVTTSQEMCIQRCIDNTIICISGETGNEQQFVTSTNAAVMSALLPPYEATMLRFNGDLIGFYNMYQGYLMTDVPSKLIACILSCLYIGRNILIYLTPDEYEVGYMDALKVYFQNRFGIVIGDKDVEFGMDPKFNAANYEYLFLYDMITADELINALRTFKTISQVVLQPMTISKIILEKGIMVNSNNAISVVMSMIYDNLSIPVVVER